MPTRDAPSDARRARLAATPKTAVREPTSPTEADLAAVSHWDPEAVTRRGDLRSPRY